MGSLKVTSSAFSHNQNIPAKYTCKGEDFNPSLHVEGFPPETQSLVLIMDDPDAPVGTWDHWILWNLPVSPDIPENSVPAGAAQGVNSWGRNDYGGPCPPSGTHRYFFKVYALDTQLQISASSGKGDVERAMQGHILDKAELIGLFSK